MSSHESDKKGVLMVCLGNICRSPIAEAVFANEIKKRNLESEWFVDSAATCGYHVGSQPERRARDTMKKHGIPMDHQARVLEDDDFSRFKYIFGMDPANIKDITAEAPKGGTAQILMLGDFHPTDKGIIRDPYYDNGSEGFEVCYQRCQAAVSAFLDDPRH